MESTTVISAAPGDAMDRIKHVERQYQAFPGSQYVLPSDAQEAERLSRQHRLWLNIFGNRLIFPDISFRGDECILESGTANGTWLLDVISRDIVPRSVAFEGIDIEPRIFPVDNALVAARGNVRFSVNTITKLPLEWENKFTLINQRLLIAALRAEEWKLAVGEMYRVLVPGGWVQLGEVGRWEAGPVTAKATSLIHALFAAKGMVADCAVQIPDMLRGAGFATIHIEEKVVPISSRVGEEAGEMGKNLIDVMRGMKTPILNAGGFGIVKSEAEMDALLDAAIEELDRMPSANIRWSVFCGQKPVV
ncbi:uncharacterized protein FIBRA_03395 [Fibroporia radiculosa]|uniref:Methyltransferase domain-containing protein n=1 Tax=Fibroporia radiculosa TaxID=599839 RepID=J4GNG4_9APHY|nr:uncharacterized protein FIBRA_03395 [Fibroporia radiculosa]CCM01345.1 predicted protein [Fibroporia radiculosa]